MWMVYTMRARAPAQRQLQHSRFGLRYADNLSSTMKIVFILAKRTHCTPQTLNRGRFFRFSDSLSVSVSLKWQMNLALAHLSPMHIFFHLTVQHCCVVLIENKAFIWLEISLWERCLLFSYLFFSLLPSRSLSLCRSREWISTSIYDRFHNSLNSQFNLSLQLWRTVRFNRIDFFMLRLLNTSIYYIPL